MQRIFSAVVAHLREYWWQYLRYGGLAVLTVLGLGVAAGLAIGMLSVGATFYAAIAIAVVLFFAVAWLPYAVFLLVVGFLRPHKQLITVRAKNSLVILCIATILGGIDLRAGSATPLETVTGLSLETVYAYAAIFVSVAFAVYLRLIYQEGVAWALPAVQRAEADSVAKGLTLPSSIIMNLFFDLVGPLLLVLIVIDLGGCGARPIISDGADVAARSLGRWVDGTVFKAAYQALQGIEISPLTSALSEGWSVVAGFAAGAFAAIPEQYLGWLGDNALFLNYPKCAAPL